MALMLERRVSLVYLHRSSHLSNYLSARKAKLEGKYVFKLIIVPVVQTLVEEDLEGDEI